MKAFFIILALALVIAAAVTFLISRRGGTSSSVKDFETCVRANYEVFDTFPKQCKTPSGEIYTEVIDDSTEPGDELIDDPIDTPILDGTAPLVEPTIIATTEPQTSATSPSNPNRIFDNGKIKFEYPNNWEVTDDSKSDTFGLTINVHTGISNIKSFRIVQESDDLKNVKSNDVLTEIPFVISNKNGFRWKLSSKDGKSYEYFTSGPNLEGSIGLRVKVNEFNKETDELLANFVETITIKNRNIPKPTPDESL